MTFSTRACAKWQPAMNQKTIIPGKASVQVFKRSLRSLIFQPELCIGKDPDFINRFTNIVDFLS